MAENVVVFLLDKLSVILQEKLRELKGLREAVESIKDELESMRAVLRVADSMEEGDAELKVWVKQIRDVAYDIEDFLDKFTFHLAQDQQNSWLPNAFLRCTRNIGFTSEIKSIRERIIGISQRRQRYQYKFNNDSEQSMNASDMAYDRRGDALLVEESDLVGIKSRKEELMEWILKSDSRLGVVSVVGMGGLGKTTLVKKVYDDAQVKKHFQAQAWITVSQSFKIDELLKEAIQLLFDEAKQPLPEGIGTMTSNQLKSLMKQFLMERRYFLVFDDLWSVQAWEAIKYALPNASLGSRVMITTRVVDVGLRASTGTSGHVYHLKPLTQEESWALFCQKVFHGGPCPPHMMEIAHSILRWCAGLPLAIHVAIGGVLATKRESRFDDWVILENSLGAEFVVNDTLGSMKRIMLLSFNDLPYYLKSCFLYLSLYPENHLIERNPLIRMWIMEGFVMPKQGRTVEEIAEGYLNELVNRNLIRLVRSNDDGSVKSIRVHDFFREMILSKSKDQSFLMIANEQTTEWIGRVRRLSIHGSFGKTFQVQNFSTQLRSLVLFGVSDPESISSIIELMKRSKVLKVLDLSDSGLEEFPKAITKLLQLRYLSMRSTKVKTIPKSIKNLQKLETLDLKHSYVTELPVEILKLQNLRHLIVYRCKQYSYLTFDFTIGFRPPIGMGVLTSIHQLAFLEASPESGILKELGKMKELRRLCIVNLRMEDGRDACAAIEQLHRLRTLNISSREEDEILDLKHMASPPVFIQRIYMSGRLATFPEWIKSLDNLVKIYFRWSRLSEDPLAYLQDLPNLVHLEFLMAYVGDELCFRAGKFRKLRLLNLDKVEPLRQVIVEEGAMPDLEKIIIQRCSFLQTVPIGIECLRKMRLLEFFDMPDEFIAKLRPGNASGDYWKVAHIPEVYYTYWKEEGWEVYPLESELQNEKNSGKPRTAIRVKDQRNSL